jgi:hypothetical protein
MEAVTTFENQSTLFALMKMVLFVYTDYSRKETILLSYQLDLILSSNQTFAHVNYVHCQGLTGTLPRGLRTLGQEK